MDHELALLQRSAQPALQHQPLERLGIHVVGVELVVIAALLLGPAERVGGVLDQRVGIVAIMREERDADTGTCSQLVSVDLKRRPQRLQELLRDAGGGLRAVGAEQQHHELVTAEPGHGVASPQRLGKTIGHALDDLVAGDQAEQIVDQLEPVEVDQHHRQQLAGSTRPLDRLGQAVVEQEPVRQAGQRIVIGEAAQGLLSLLPAR